MEIGSSNILMASVRTYAERDEEREIFRAWLDGQDRQVQEDKVSLSENCRKCIDGLMTDIDSADSNKAGAQTKTMKTLKALLVEILSGREVKILDPSELQQKQVPVEQGVVQNKEEIPLEQEREGWGVEYSHQESRHEREGVVFVTAGIIQTADGSDMEFSLRLNMSREFMYHHSLNFRAGDAVLMDPLVVNFDGKAAELRDMKFSFDLDSDGAEEELPTIGPGSGFLSLDLNKDGIINNGNELFGPRTDDGFSELAEYDEDRNRWIDENDPIYDELSVWTMDHHGTSSLNSLKERGIGAIYLGNLSSRFDLRTQDNSLMGQISSTGIFLNEDGTPGTIQQLDLVV